MPPSPTPVDHLPRAAHAAELSGQGWNAPEWVQLLPAGRFKGRDGRGPYTLADAAAVIEASRRQSPDGKLPIDYDHQTDFGAQPGVGGTAPAAGWIVELQARADGIWARVEWTERARQHVAGREYRFLSPVFAHTKQGGEIVAVLRASLTNTPNLDLTAVASRGGTTDPNGGTMDLAQLKQALGLSADAGDDAVLQAAQSAAGARTRLQEIAQALGQNAMDDPAKLVQAAQHVRATADALPKVAQSLGLDPHVAADKLVAKTQELATAAQSAGQPPDPNRYVPRDQYDGLAQRVSALETAQTTQAATQRADAAIQAGKIPPANRDWAITYAARDPQGFDQFVANQPGVLAGGEVVPGGQPANGGDAAATLTHTEKQVCAQMGLDEDAYLKVKTAGGAQ